MKWRAASESPSGGERVVEEVAGAVEAPEREVDVAAVARRVGPRLRRQRGDVAELRRDAADRLADEELLVGGRERRRMPGRDLLLAVAELRVELLQRDALPVERRRRARRRSPARPSSRSSRSRGSRRPAGSRPSPATASVNSFSKAASSTAPRSASRACCRFRNERWQTAAGRAVEPDVVDEQRPGMRRVGQHAERVEIGDEPDLADRAHPLDRLQLVEPVHRLHRDRQHRSPPRGARRARGAPTPWRARCRRSRTRGSGRAGAPPRRPAERSPPRPTSSRDERVHGEYVRLLVHAELLEDRHEQLPEAATRLRTPRRRPRGRRPRPGRRRAPAGPAPASRTATGAGRCAHR